MFSLREQVIESVCQLSGLKKEETWLRDVLEAFQILESIDKSATIRKAMPVKNKSPPVKKYTMAATIIAGISTRNSFIRIITIKPIMTRTMRKGMLNDPSPKLLRIENIIGNKIPKFIRQPQ